MCLILFAWRAHPQHPLVVLANRDEFYDRPAKRAGFWADEPDLLAGRDRRGKGTWLGLTRQGRFAAITNYREPTAEPVADRPSRGLLVRDYLLGDDSPQAFAEAVLARGSEYAGFNLLVGDREQLLCVSNRRDGVVAIEPGVHGISNGGLDPSWPKVARGTDALRAMIDAGAVGVEGSLELLADRTLPVDADLPDTGLGLEVERELAPIFVATERYGTRSSTVLTVNADDQVLFVECVFDASGAPDGSRGYSFSLAPR